MHGRRASEERLARLGEGKKPRKPFSGRTERSNAIGVASRNTVKVQENKSWRRNRKTKDLFFRRQIESTNKKGGGEKRKEKMLKGKDRSMAGSTGKPKLTRGRGPRRKMSAIKKKEKRENTIQKNGSLRKSSGPADRKEAKDLKKRKNPARTRNGEPMRD